MFRFREEPEDRLLIVLWPGAGGDAHPEYRAGMLLKKLVESSGAGVGDRSLGTLFGVARAW